MVRPCAWRKRATPYAGRAGLPVSPTTAQTWCRNTRSIVPLSAMPPSCPARRGPAAWWDGPVRRWVGGDVAGIAVVTGSSSGIGAATARRLAADGYSVVVAARREDRLAALAGEIGGRALRLDVTDQASVDGFAAALDSCDVLVNNAGGALGLDPVAAGEPADWQWMFDVNVLGTLRMTRALLPLLRSGAGGTIVNVTSTAAFTNYEGGGGYSAAKHGQHALTETLRLELAGVPVRVIEIAAGMVRTDEFSVKRFGGDAEKAAAI